MNPRPNKRLHCAPCDEKYPTTRSASVPLAPAATNCLQGHTLSLLQLSGCCRSARASPRATQSPSEASPAHRLQPTQQRSVSQHLCRILTPANSDLTRASASAQLGCKQAGAAAHEGDVRQHDPIAWTIRSLERDMAAAHVQGRLEAMTACAVEVAALHIGRRDLHAASAAFDACVAACCAASDGEGEGQADRDASLRAALLQRVLPMSMEVLNMQGRTAESFARWRLLNHVLVQCGRSVAEECPICAEPFSQDRACLALACGHSFHRDCCDAWLGRRMLLTGTFRPECPVCKQLDPAFKPTPAAAQALRERGRVHQAEADGRDSSSSSGDDSTSGRESVEGSGSESGRERSGNGSSGSGSLGGERSVARWEEDSESWETGDMDTDDSEDTESYSDTGSADDDSGDGTSGTASAGGESGSVSGEAVSDKSESAGQCAQSARREAVS